MANNKYFAILDGDKTLFVEITPERVEAITYLYEGDEAWYLADVLSEEFGFSINNVQWSVISPNNIKFVGEPIHLQTTPPKPSSSFIIQHYVYDDYEGGVGPDRIYGPYDTREEALEVLAHHTYENEWHEILSPDIDVEKGRAKYYDGWYNHVLTIKKL